MKNLLATILLAVLLGGCRPPSPAPAAADYPSAVVEIARETDFDEALRTHAVVMVDFHAAWCGPCQMLKPTIAQLSMDYRDRVAVLGVDVDKQDALARRYDIQSIPTILIFKDAQLQARLVGRQQRDAYESVLQKLVMAVPAPATPAVPAGE